MTLILEIICWPWHIIKGIKANTVKWDYIKLKPMHSKGNNPTE